MDEQQKSQLMSNDHTAFIVFPNAEAVVKILEILHPFPEEIRAMILDVVQKNPDYPSIVSRGTRNNAFHHVLMSARLAAVAEQNERLRSYESERSVRKSERKGKKK